MLGDKDLGDKRLEDASTAVLKELVIQLRDHSEALRRDIRRLQRALVEINRAIALSLERVERLRGNTEKLRAIFGNGEHSINHAENKRSRIEQRSGADRRSGLDRRRARSEVRGLLRWIEGTALDRRKTPERRSVEDRRRTDQNIEKSDPLVVPMTVRRRSAGEVISLADYRRSRKAAPRKPRS